MQKPDFTFEYPYYYIAFGMILASQIELAELTPCKEAVPDVCIRVGEIPKDFGKVTYQRKYMKMGVDFYWLSVPEVGTYYTRPDGTILVEPDPASHPKNLRMWLFSFCIPAVLFFTGRLPLHGSSLEINGMGVLLTGKSGAGKSTLATYFLMSGHSFVSDDLSTVILDGDGVPLLHGSTPNQKLCQDAITRLGRKKASDFVYRGLGTKAKYAVKATQRIDNPIPLRMMVELNSSDVPEPTIREIVGAEKLQMILQNTYRNFMLKGLRLKPWHFLTCHKLAQQISCYQVTRPKKGYWEKELYQLIAENGCKL